MKAYPGLSPDQILYEISYANVALYSSIIPSGTKPKKEQNFDASKDANNPDNFKASEEIIVVKSKRR